MLGDNIPKYPYTITVGYYASEEIPFLGGVYKHSNTNLIAGSKSEGNSFSLLNQSFDGSYGEYTISSDSPELGLIASSTVSHEPIYGGGLFAGALYRDSNGEIFNKLDVVQSCILGGDIEHLSQFDSYIDGWGPIDNTISELKLPESLKVIEEEALSTWHGLKQLEIPMGVIELKELCLPPIQSSSVALRTLILKPTTPPISSNIFPNSDYIPEDFKIRVYPHVVNVYKKDEYYGQYSQYIDTINNSIVGDLTIPTSAFKSNGSSVTQTNSIQDGNYKIFEYSGELTEVIADGFKDSYPSVICLPNSITKIGARGFYNHNLQEITLGNGIIDIGSFAFYTVPNSNTFRINYLGNIQDWCNIHFTDLEGSPLKCRKDTKFYIQGELLTDLVIPEGVSTFNEYAFYNLKQLTSVTFPTTFTGVNITNNYYDFAVFDLSTNIESIIWNAKECGDFQYEKPLFRNLPNLKFITIGNDVEYLPRGIINNREHISIDSLTIPSSIKKISNCFNTIHFNTVFWDSENCESNMVFNTDAIVFSDNVKYIPQCFAQPGIRSITIGKNVERIDQPFQTMFNLNSMYISNLSTWCVLDASQNSNNNTHNLYVKDQLISNLIIPEDVNYINNYKFSNTTIESLTIPNNVKDVSETAFDNCDYLSTLYIDSNLVHVMFDLGITSYTKFENLGITTVQFGENVSYIAPSLFNNNNNLVNVSLSNSIKRIYTSAFRSTSLSTIDIPDGVKYIGEDAFEDTPFSNTLPDGLVYLGKNLYAYKGTLSEGVSITLDNDTVSISGYCFLGQSNLSEILLPDSIKILGRRCFSDTGLNTLNIPESVEEIGRGIVDDTPLYENTENWENGCLYIDNCLLNINNNTFSGTELILKDTTRIMADDVIWLDTNLTKIITNEGLAYLGNIYIPESNLEEIFISKTVNSIKNLFIVSNSSLNITVDADNPVYDSRGCNAIVKTDTNELIYGCNVDVIPNTIEYVNILVNTHINQLYIPNSVKYIASLWLYKNTEITYEGTFKQFISIVNIGQINNRASVTIKCSDGDFTIN